MEQVMGHLEAIKILRICLRPSVSTMKVTSEDQYIHTCKQSSTHTRVAEAIIILGGEIISQEEADDKFVTVASLPAISAALITPGDWGGSKPGRIYKKSRETTTHKLTDIRLYDRQHKMLQSLSRKWFGSEGKTTSKTIRRLIEETAEREGIT